MEAPDCTAMCRKEAAGVDHHPGLLGGSGEGGILEEVGDQLDGLVPFDGPAGVERIFFSAKGRSLSSRATMLHQ